MKRDVVLQLAKENRDLRMYDPEAIEPKELIEQDYQDWIREYDDALPDDLPVIPQAVGEWIKECHHRNFILSNMLCTEMRPESVRWWMAFKDGLTIGNHAAYNIVTP